MNRDKSQYVHIQELRCQAKIGLLPKELKETQEICLSLKLGTSLEKAMHSDNLEDTVDYAEIVEKVEALCLERQYQLCEHLAYEIGKVVLEKCDWVEIDLMKPNIFVNAKGVGVHLLLP